MIPLALGMEAAKGVAGALSGGAATSGVNGQWQGPTINVGGSAASGGALPPWAWVAIAFAALLVLALLFYVLKK